MAAFTMLLHMLRDMIEDAKHQHTGDQRLKKYDQVFNYLGYVLYLSRRTASHDLIAFGEHKFLMDFAEVRGFPPAKKKELRDPYKVAARNSIYAYGDSGGGRKGTTRAPRQDRPREGKTRPPSKTARKRARGDRVPAAGMTHPPHYQCTSSFRANA